MVNSGDIKKCFFKKYCRIFLTNELQGQTEDLNR